MAERLDRSSGVGGAPVTGQEAETGEMIAALAARGYLIAKIPDCKLKGRGHGRHGLITRTAVCEGENPIPHGFSAVHGGSFGLIVNCSCGHAFRDDAEPGEMSAWDRHCAEFEIEARHG